MSSSSNCPPPGGAWNDRNPTFKRSIRMLFKKQFLIKIRNYSSIIEWVCSCLIFFIIIPIYYLATTSIKDAKEPQSSVLDPTLNLQVFVGQSESYAAFYPNVDVMRNFVQNYNIVESTYFTYTIDEISKSEDFSFSYDLYDNEKDLRKAIESRSGNGFGVAWVNHDDSNAFTEPKVYLYKQSLMSDPYVFLLPAFTKYLIEYNQTGQTNLGSDPVFNAPLYKQQYAVAASKEYIDISVAVSLFVVLPIILATMPDFQSILEEKETKVAALAFLMGCSETAYWIVNFVTPFVLSFIPYIIVNVTLCFGIAMTRTDFTLMMVISILFIISHLFFILFLLTFMQKASNGRAIIVVMIIFAMFFSYLHYFWTLDSNSKSDSVKHITSLIPLSCYQMVYMAAYMQEINKLTPFTWSSMGKGTGYPASWAILWLLADCFIYFFLFVLFNAVMPRSFGTPPLSWRELFSRAAYKRIFGDQRMNQVSARSDTFIAVNRLCKEYNQEGKIIKANHNIDFSIKSGEVIILIGPNGSGKSTLINTLTGSIEPTSGTVKLLNSEKSNRFTEVQKYLGVCYQGNVIFPKLSVREHLQMFGSFRGVPEDQIETAIQFFGEQLQLSHMLDNRAGDLSGGQKRKLCIAMSLLGNPPLVVMDEPTAGVDVQARQLIWKIISSLRNSTCIITSHALEEAEAVSTRLFILSGGRLKFQGTSTELRNQHKCGYILSVSCKKGIDLVHQYVQRFIPDAELLTDRPDSIAFPVVDQIPKLLESLEAEKQALGINTYALSVEQLEDMLMKLIQTEEAKNAM